MTRSTRARRTDPETSHAAAAAQEPKLRASHARVLAMFKLYGEMHDRQLEAYLHDAEKMAGMKRMSPSGIRSRRSELAKPNMDRLDEIAVEIDRERNQAWPVGRAFGDTPVIHGYADLSDDPNATCPVTGKPLCKALAVRRLRDEGFRSPLWDTGRRETVDGHRVIVWGIAR
jgi:hypothetical protein